MLIQEIAQITSGRFLVQCGNPDIKTLNIDSRKSSGSDSELFIALAGVHHNGHDFIGQLYASGVRNFLVSGELPVNDLNGANVLKVSNSLEALQQISAHHRYKHDIPIIGITGSNGKTIVKEWLSTLLEKQWHVVKSPKSYNSQVGVPLSVWQLDGSHEMAVFEAGISKTGEMQNLASIIRPSYGIFTNIGSAHDEGFGGMKEKVEEKARLFAESKYVVCRLEHSLIHHILETRTSAQIITWSIDNPQADCFFRPENDFYHGAYKGRDFRFKIRVNSTYDLENILHAITLALVVGEEQELIQSAIDSIRPVPMRLELKRGTNGTYVLDDSYNNDLQGLKIALEYMLQQPKKEKKTVILSDILQSGKSQKELYGEVNALLQKHEVSRLIGIGTEISGAESCFTLPAAFFRSAQDFMKGAPVFSDELVLVKGARAFGLEKVVSFLEEKSHGTVLEVNFEALIHNLNVYRKKLRPDVRLMVMVKAFAYGVGVEEIAHLLQYHKVDYLGVAYLDEAILLRKKGINLPIMIMNPDWESLSLLEPFDLEPEIYSLQMLSRFLDENTNPPPIHLKIETGMNRLGFQENDLPELVTILQANPHLKVAGIFTHFSSSDDPDQDDYTFQQAAAFEKAYQILSDALHYKPLKHALNSSGIARFPDLQYDMVRLGIGLYGFDSTGQVKDLRVISSLKTKVSQVKSVQKGDSIGYSRKGRALKNGEIATIAIGYADGYSRAFGNGNAFVMINGQKAKTIGNICMDMTMIDVTGLDVKAGDEVVVFGEQPTIVDLAEWTHTIPYEILTNVSQRVKRVFISE